MASKTISFSKVFLAMAVILVSINVQGSAAHSPFCKKCNPGPQINLCESLVKGATTWEGAMTNVMNEIEKEIEKGKPIITNLSSSLPLDLLPISKESIGSTCKEEFEGIEEDLNNVLDQIKNGDPIKSIPTELSAIMTYVSDCTDSIQEFDIHLPKLTVFGNGLQNYVSISLAIASIKYHYT